MPTEKHQLSEELQLFTWQNTTIQAHITNSS